MLRGMKYVTEDTLIIVEASLDTDFSYLPQLDFKLVREKNIRPISTYSSKEGRIEEKI